MGTQFPFGVSTTTTTTTNRNNKLKLAYFPSSAEKLSHTHAASRICSPSFSPHWPAWQLQPMVSLPASELRPASPSRIVCANAALSHLGKGEGPMETACLPIRRVPIGATRSHYQQQQQQLWKQQQQQLWQQLQQPAPRLQQP